MLISLLSLAGLYISISAVLPDKIIIKKSLVILASPEKVYDEILDFNNQKYWSPLMNYDHQLKTNIIGNINDKNYQMTWLSENERIGNGSIIRAGSVKNLSILNHIHLKDFGIYIEEKWDILEIKSGAYLTLTSTIYLRFILRIPLNLMNISQIAGPDMEQSILKLKKKTEGNQFAFPENTNR